MKTNVRKFWVCIIVIAMMAQILVFAPVMVSAATYYQINSRWKTTQYLYDDGTRVNYGIGSGDNYLWSLEDYSGYKRIKNKNTGEYINIKNGATNVECTAITESDTTSHWTIAQVSGAPSQWKSVQCRSNSNYLNNEGQLGYITCDRTNVPDNSNSFSEQWQLIDAGGPTPTPTPTPTPASGTLKIEAESYSSMYGITNGGTVVGGLDTGDWCAYSNVNLGNGYTGFETLAASAGSGNMQIRLDSTTGTLLGTCYVSNTGGWTNWQSFTCSLTGAIGTHTIYLVFEGAFNYDWFKFTGPTTTPTPTPTPGPTPTQGPTPTPALRGATVSFTTYEAESATLGGNATLNNDSIIKESSSGKSYAQLDATGEYVQFNSLIAATRLTLRYSIPQNTTGTISLYLNGAHNQDINLTSAQCYDTDNCGVRRYDEKFVTITIAAGNNVKIQKDSGDTCSWYAIDLIDIETAPAALSMPANYLSITDYGANGGDANDDLTAINNCVSAASAQGKGVWIPSGTFYQSSRVTIPASVNVKGAGIWYSCIHYTNPGSNWSDDQGFALSSNTTISNIRFDGVGYARSHAAIIFRPIGNYETIQNCWIQNVGCISGWDDGHNNTISNNRFRGTYYDGVHWGDGACYSNLVENNHMRGMGDDSIAQVNRVDMGLAHDNTARFNTIVASYWGRGISDVGGDSLTITDNIIDSTYMAGFIVTTEDLSPSKSRPIQGVQFLRNTLNKCGHTGHNHASIHFWLDQDVMKNVVIANNLIQNGETEGIHIDDTNYGDSGGRTQFNYNTAQSNAGGNYTNASNDIVPVLNGNTGF